VRDANGTNNRAQKAPFAPAVDLLIIPRIENTGPECWLIDPLRNFQAPKVFDSEGSGDQELLAYLEVV